MSKLTDRSKKDIFYPSTGLEQDRNNKPVKKLTGENTGEIKKDKSGKDYSLIQETTENFIKGDTIKVGNLPRVDNFIQGGDYKVSETPESKKRATDEPRTFSPVRLENKYSSMKSMGQAVAKWTSPHSSLMQKGKVNVGAMSELTSSIDKQREEAKAQAKIDAEEKQKKREKATDITQGIGRAMAAAGGTTVKTPSKSAQEKGQETRDKEKKDKDKKEVEVDTSAEGLKKGDIGKT
tara:strand:+ start:724 stop:1431 length:708 start_codon:yes stop_codon:yes gene_type:complete